MSFRPDISAKKIVTVLVVDDSLVFRRLLCDLVEDSPEISIIAEAKNGIEALDQILKTSPDVILMDLEMPLMDGMTALQHLMVHRPTPTIIFSSLTSEGTARAFDSIKNGAIDFICKDFVFEEDNYPLFKKIVLEKVLGAARMEVAPVELFNPSSLDDAIAKPKEKVVFCEDCGSRQVVTEGMESRDNAVRCIACGDIIYLHHDDKYKSNKFLTIITGDNGVFSNLLNVIPRFESDMTGSILCVIDAPVAHVDAFSDYLDSVSCLNVMRGAADLSIEGGNCYLIAASEQLCLKPYSVSLKLQKFPQSLDGVGAVDLMVASVAKVFKSKTAIVAASGNSKDGLRGISQIVKSGGSVFTVPEASCLYNNKVRLVKEKFSVDETDELELVRKIKILHKNSIPSGM